MKGLRRLSSLQPLGSILVRYKIHWLDSGSFRVVSSTSKVTTREQIATLSSSITMQKSSSLLLLIVAVALLLILEDGALAYRKPPFNGSIFGKRGSSAADFDAAVKALSSMCEIATEACSAWFPQNESNN